MHIMNPRPSTLSLGKVGQIHSFSVLLRLQPGVVSALDNAVHVQRVIEEDVVLNKKYANHDMKIG